MSENRMKDQPQAAAGVEHTRQGNRFIPAVDIFETDTAITVIADMPGVRTEDLDIDLRENILTLSGDVHSRESDGERGVIREYGTGTYFRQFTLSDAIDQGKIDAKLENGVLRLSLPKVGKATPRKITVTAE